MSMIEDMEDAPHTVLRCPECAAPNLRQQNFCAKCGTPLWLSCLQCGAMCAVGENYCGACGANLEETGPRPGGAGGSRPPPRTRSCAPPAGSKRP